MTGHATPAGRPLSDECDPAAGTGGTEGCRARLRLMSLPGPPAPVRATGAADRQHVNVPAAPRPHALLRPGSVPSCPGVGRGDRAAGCRGHRIVVACRGGDIDGPTRTGRSVVTTDQTRSGPAKVRRPHPARDRRGGRGPSGAFAPVGEARGHSQGAPSSSSRASFAKASAARGRILDRSRGRGPARCRSNGTATTARARSATVARTVCSSIT